MGHANIYIRKNNETKWNNIPDKSAWINAMIARSGAKEIYFDRAKPKPIVEAELKKVIAEPQKKVKSSICKQHGIDKNLCRMMKH